MVAVVKVVGDGGHIEVISAVPPAEPVRGQAGFGQPLPESVLRAARAGDRNAQGEIYRLYADAVYTLALRTTGCSEQAQDVAHDAFVNGLRGLNGYRGDAPFGMWLRQITARVAVAHVRKQRVGLGGAEEVGEYTQPLHEDPAAGCDLQHQLSRLPAQTRTVLWLHLAEGYGHEEIARMFGKSVSFSKSQVARSLGRLRQWMS